MPTKHSLNYQLLALTLAVLYGSFLASLPLDIFKDRNNYLVYAEHSADIFERYQLAGPLVILANEPLWLLANIGLAKLFPPDLVLQTLIFIPATIVAWFILRYDHRQFTWLLLFLLLPQVIKNHIIHLRQGFAIAVFLSGWFSENRIIRWLLLSTTPFIHSSFFFVLFLLTLVRMLLSLRLAADLHILLVVCVAIILGGSDYWLADLFGARQATLYTFEAELSGLGFAFWSLIFIVMLFQGRQFLRLYAFEVSTIIFFLGTYFFSPVTGRIFESTLLLVLLSGLQLISWRYLVFIGLLVFYTLLQWLMRLDLPNFGWGL